MRLNRLGVVLLAFFGGTGTLLLIVPTAVGAPGTVAGILALIGAIWVVVALGLLLYARREKRKAAHQDWVFRNGVRGTATVLSASSHLTFNEMPVMKLRLRLAVPGVPAGEVERRVIMSVFAARRMTPGLRLPVYVNPGDHADIVLVW